jgi:adenylate kinase family enzyme
MNKQPKRIMIFGRSGSGKSTFATWLAEKLTLPLHHLDKHFYVANWVERDYNEFLQIQQNLVNSDCWVIDGNSIRSLEMRWSKADFSPPISYLKIKI